MRVPSPCKSHAITIRAVWEDAAAGGEADPGRRGEAQGMQGAGRCRACPKQGGRPAEEGEQRRRSGELPRSSHGAARCQARRSKVGRS